MDSRIIQYKESANYIKSKIGEELPKIAVILGSGLSRLADDIQNPVVIPYKDIPGFAQATATGHKSNLIYGTLGGKKVLAMQGRFHYYEGYTMEQVTYPIRVMAVLGIEVLFVSNAAGGINPNFKVGDLMIIDDHINLLPNPLIGANIEQMGTRFPDMTWAYDRNLILSAKEVAGMEGMQLQEGIYVGSTGPTFETRAEYKYLERIGADAAGMSTVPEVIVARHCGVRVFGVSVISNEAHTFDEDYKNDGEDVVKAANTAGKNLSLLIEKMIGQLA